MTGIRTTTGSGRARWPGSGRVMAGAAAGALVVVLAACGGGTASTTTSAGGAGSTVQASPSTSGTPSSTAAASPVSSALATAYQSERDAQATYANVLARLGQIQPFVNVHESEGQHVLAIETVARSAGVTLPTTAATGQPSPSTKAAACRLGTSVEEANIALYDRLLPQVSTSAAVTKVFATLQGASRDAHLPAFERCA